MRGVSQFDGRYLVHELWAKVITNQKAVKPCIAKFRIKHECNFPGAEFKGQHKSEVVIRKMY